MLSPRALCFLILTIGVTSTASAAEIIFNRDLPSSLNVNSAGCANGSNVAWENQIFMGNYFIVGDNIDLSFTPNSQGQWFIDSISVWEVANTPISSATSAFPPAG